MSKSKGNGDKRLVIGQPVDEDELKQNGEHDPTDLVDAPRIGSPRFGLAGKLWRIHRNHKKEKRYADQGYVKWYRVGSGWPSPKFIKPSRKGGGIPEYETDGVTYLFPKEAMIPDRDSGMFCVIHKEGEAEPLNMTDPTANAIMADELNEYLTKRVTSSPPSWWDNINLDAQDIIPIAIGALIIIAALQQVMGGGF